MSEINSNPLRSIKRYRLDLYILNHETEKEEYQHLQADNLKTCFDYALDIREKNTNLTRWNIFDRLTGKYLAKNCIVDKFGFLHEIHER